MKKNRHSPFFRQALRQPRPQFAAALLAIAAPLWASLLTQAAPPDLTNGGVPGDTISSNLGPTGARGWVYHDKADTGESRQILIHAVDAGSPASGILAANDVILGASGTGANPAAFAADARRSLAQAIADAEARTPATLKLLHWRAGTTTTVQLNLRTLGAYSATAPYNCPKSTRILNEGLAYFFNNQTAGRYSFGTIALLATGNPAYAARAQSEARALVPNAATRAQLMSDERDANSMITWQRGHTLIVLAEYYLATGDATVLPGVEAYAVNIAKNHSLFGTVGHIFAEKNLDGSANGPMGGVYGVVNSTGMPCFLGLLLAKQCGLTNPELDPAIERSSRFFAYYSGKGSIPYGEHSTDGSGHENNGKSGLAALIFSLQPNRITEQKFFAKMATAAASERELGHTGAFFNYLWAPLGANCGGEEAAASHFSRIAWHLDLARCWNGGFAYDCLNDGPNSGSEYHDFRMATAAILTYALPLRKLHITGKLLNQARWLSSTDVAEAATADLYNPQARTTGELLADLSTWSPKTRRNAAIELAARSVSTAQLNQLHSQAADTNAPVPARVGACEALGSIANSSSATVLAALLTDSNNHVRYIAAEALRYLPDTARRSVVNTILAAAASTAQPLLPMIEEDPLHFAHGRLAMLLFYSGSASGPKGILYKSLAGIDRNLLYPAIRAVAANPIGKCRSTLASIYAMLTREETMAVADAIVDSVRIRAPADKMFSASVRQEGLETLQKYDFAEGVPAGEAYIRDEVRDDEQNAALGVLEAYAGSCTTVVPDPDIIGFLQELLPTSIGAAAQKVLDAIANDPNPAPLTPFKSIQSVTADAPSMTLPAHSTVLRVSALDHAMGASIFTWRKLQGPGAVAFTPNGTSATSTAVDLAAVPGPYLFEVTMSDSRNLTEVSATVGLTVVDPSDTTAPTPNPLTWGTPPAAASSTAITMTATTASDPGGVQYFFDCTTAGGHDSAWQDSPTYTDIGLTPSTSSTYQVKARDKSPAANETGLSPARSATTSAPDLTAPAIATLSPADNTIGAPASANLVVTFNEAITIGTGNITLRNLTDSTQSAIAITDATQVSVAGAVLTINPTTDLVSGRSYAIQIASTAIKDLANNPFAGIADDTTWNFTTVLSIYYTWTQTAGGAQDWTTGANWSGGSAPSPLSDDTVDFSTVNIAADTTLTLGADRIVGIWKFGDTSGTNTWTVNAGNKMILAGTTPTINVVQHTVTLNNVVDGIQGLTKTGFGTLTLSGTNTYTGGTVINAGALTVAADTNLGAAGGGITFNGSATFTPGQTFSSSARSITINNNATVTFGRADATATFSGDLTGTGGIAMGSSSTTQVIFNGTGNTFEGKIAIGADGTSNKSYRFAFASLTDSATANGRIVFSTKNGVTTADGSVFEYTGSTPLVLNNRQIELASAAANPTNGHQVRSNGMGALTVNTDLIVSTAVAQTLALNGTGAGIDTFAGKIADGTGAVVSLIKADAGTWRLTHANNSFTGLITLSSTTTSAGTLSYASAAGTNPITFAQTTGTAILAYTGAAPLTMSGLITASALTTGTITLDASGVTAADTINYSNAGSLGTAASGIRKLVLSGSNTGANTFAGQWVNNTGAAATLTKNGAGTWVLTGANTYTGPTTVSAGKLFINGNQSTATGDVSVSAGATLGGTGTLGGTTTIAATGKLEFNLRTAAAGHDKLELAATKALAFAGASTLTITSSGGASPGDYTLVTAPGGFGASVPPATVNLPTGWTADAPRFVGNDLMLNITASGSGYASWQSINGATGQTLAQDHDHDGVPNGIEWFIKGSNSSTGSTALPGVDTDPGTGALSVTWTKAATYTGSYGADFVVETSADLTGTWNAEASPGTVTLSGNDVKYIFPSPPGAKKFARLKVTGP